MDSKPASANMTDSALLGAFLSTNPQIRFIHLQWLDYTSTLRARVFPLVQVQEMMATGRLHRLGGLNMTLIDDSAPLTVDNPAGPVGEPVGQARLRPDMASIRPCPGLDGHASLFCDFETVSVGADEAVLTPADTAAFCPRRALQRAVASAAQGGLRFLVGFEIEFVCVPQDGRVLGVHQTSGLRTLEAYMMPVLCRLSEELAKSGMPIQHFHAEGTENQYEVATAPLPPLEAADAFIATREAIRRVCRAHGMVVSFHPWSPAQNGVHVNLSLHRAAWPGQAGNSEQGGGWRCYRGQLFGGDAAPSRRSVRHRTPIRRLLPAHPARTPGDGSLQGLGHAEPGAPHP